MLIGYARISKADDSQVLDLQIDALRNAGVLDEHIYTDKISGVKDDRPGLESCLKALRQNDTLIVWKLDRLGRNLKHLISTVDDLNSKSINLIPIKIRLILQAIIIIIFFIGVTKVAILMLLLWLYFVLNYQKKLTLPSSYNKSTYLKIDPYDEKSYKFLSKLNPHEYNTENYDTMYLIYTDSSDKINIKRTDIFSLLLPAVISTALLWTLFHLVFKGDIPSDEGANTYATIAAIFVSFLISFYFTVKNLNAIKHIGIFDYKTKQYKANDYNKTISFNDIYGYTIIFKTIETKREANLRENIQEKTFIEKLYILDLILSNGEVLNLMANENKNTLLAQAKIISAYTQKPIFDLGKWNYFDLKNIYLDTLTKKSD